MNQQRKERKEEEVGPETDRKFKGFYVFKKVSGGLVCNFDPKEYFNASCSQERRGNKKSIDDFL